MSSAPSDSNYSFSHVIDSATSNCSRCLMNDKTNTVKQYYVNFDTTISMCSICKSLYLMENEITINNSAMKSVSSKSLKKLSLLPFLLKETPDETLTQDEAKQVLHTAYQSYKRSLAREEAKLNDFFSLVNQLFPNQASSNRSAQNSGTVANVVTPLEDSNSGDGEDTFYFSNGLTLAKAEITDADIEAAISALSRDQSPKVNYEDLPDLDSFLAYSAEVDHSLPILSDETLLSSIHLDKIDETLKHLNEKQESGIKINIDFDALQKMLAAPSVNEPPKSSNEPTKTRSKKVERYLARTNLRPCDLLRKSQQMQLWKEKSAGQSLSKLSRGLDKVNAETKEGIVNSVKPQSESNICLFNKSDSINSSTSVVSAASSQNVVAIYSGRNSPSNDSYCREDWKMFKGFEFAEFTGEAARNSVKIKAKSKRRGNSKVTNPTLALIQRFQRQKQLPSTNYCS